MLDRGAVNDANDLLQSGDLHGQRLALDIATSFGAYGGQMYDSHSISTSDELSKQMTLLHNVSSLMCLPQFLACWRASVGS